MTNTTHIYIYILYTRMTLGMLCIFLVNVLWQKQPVQYNSSYLHELLETEVGENVNVSVRLSHIRCSPDKSGHKNWSWEKECVQSLAQQTSKSKSFIGIMEVFQCKT